LSTSGGVIPRHQLELGLRDSSDLRVRRTNVGGRLEEDLDDSKAAYETPSICSMSFTVVVSARSNGVMKTRRSSGPGASRCIANNADYRDLDVGKMSWRSQRRERAEDENQQREHTNV